MRKIAMCLVLAFLFIGVANAQTKSMTGTVVSVERGMYAWEAIVIQVGGKKYFVYTLCGDCNPKIVGKVDEVGRKATFFYSRIDRNSDGYDGEVKATRIVEIKGQASKPQNVSTRRPSKPKLGSGIFTGVISFVGKDGRRVTDIWVKSGEYTLMLDARSAVVVGGSLSDGISVRVTYKNLQNSEMDVGRAFSGKAIRIAIL